MHLLCLLSSTESVFLIILCLSYFPLLFAPPFISLIILSLLSNSPRCLSSSVRTRETYLRTFLEQRHETFRRSEVGVSGEALRFLSLDLDTRNFNISLRRRHYHLSPAVTTTFTDTAMTLLLLLLPLHSVYCVVFLVSPILL